MENRSFTKRRLVFLWKSSLVLLLLFLPLFVQGQTLSGYVRDSKGAAVGYANVTTLNAHDKMMTYAISKDDGSFTIQLPDSTVSVSVSALGYRTLVTPHKSVSDGMTFTLVAEAYHLKEVVVKSHRIQSHSDTLTYSVAGFRQKQDRSIGDVIAKMPGLEVSSDGTVKYQGKAINKYYVEGLDLLGRQYGMGNKNIPADKIVSVQVLQNHQPVKSLRGVQFSDQAALNLVLRDDARDVWSEATDLGAGWGDKLVYDNRLMALQLGRCFQTLMLYKNNNTGKDISREVKDLIKDNDGTEDPDALLSLSQSSLANLERNRYTFNDSHCVAGNWLFKLGPVSELRLQSSAFLDKTDQQSSTTTTYLSLPGLPVVAEGSDMSNKRSEWKGELNYQYNGKSSYIRNNLRGYMDFNKGDGSAVVNGMPVRRWVEPRRRSLTDVLELSHTTSDKRVWKWTTSVNWHYLPGRLLTADSLSEHVGIHNLDLRTMLHHGISIGWVHLDNAIGADYLSQDIHVGFDSIPDTQGKYERQVLRWLPEFVFSSNQHLVTVRAKVQGVRQSYDKRVKRYIWVDPQLSYRCELSSLTTATLSLSSSHQSLGLYDVSDIPVYNDYRTLMTTQGRLGATHATTTAASLKYANPLSGFFFYIQPSWQRTSGATLYRYGLHDIIYTMEATDSTTHTTTYSLRARLSKTFNWAKSFVAVGGSLQHTDYQLLLLDAVTPAQLRRTNVYVDYSLRPADWLSVEGQSSMDVTRQKLSEDNASSVHHTTNWKHMLKAFFFITDAVTLSCNNEYMHFGDHSLPSQYFADITLDWKRSHTEWSLALTNIFNKKSFQRTTITQSRQTLNTYQLRPREIVVKLSFDIN